MADRERILVRAPNWIGDAVLALGFMASLRLKHPGAEVSMLANERVAEIFRGHAAVDGLISFPGGEPIMATARRVKGRGFVSCYLLPLSFSSAAAAFLAGIPQRIGYAAELRGALLTARLPYHRKEFRSRHLLHGFCRLLGGDAVPEDPVIRPTADETDWAKAWLRGKVLDGPLAGLGPGATYGPAKRWPQERWIELGVRLAERGMRILIFGSAVEAGLCRRIAGGIGPSAVSCAGEADLRRSAALISKCGLFVTNDTGVMHLAAAVGTKVAALFGSTNPRWTGPWGSRHAVVSVNEPCSPCYKRECRYGHYRCLEGITAEMVLAAA